MRDNNVRLSLSIHLSISYGSVAFPTVAIQFQTSKGEPCVLCVEWILIGQKR